MFTGMDVSMSLDYMAKIFALTPDPPNELRAHYFIGALLFGLAANGRF